jgi:hypothetical protein
MFNFLSSVVSRTFAVSESMHAHRSKRLSRTYLKLAVSFNRRQTSPCRLFRLWNGRSTVQLSTYTMCSLQHGSADHVSILDSKSELQDEPKNPAVLFNDYALPFRMWSLCLEIVAATNHNDPTYNRQLWDAYLIQAPLPPTRSMLPCMPA